MSVKSRAGNAFLILAILTLFGLLILLIGSLDELAFQPGKRLPREESIEEESSLSQHAPRRFDPREHLFEVILLILTLVSIICVFIFRKLRREVLQYLFVMFAFVLPMILGIMLIGRLFSGWFQHRPAGEIVDTGLVIPESILANPPTWSLVLAAGAVSILIFGI